MDQHVNQQSIIIIGGGFSGVMTLVQLCRQATRPLHITLVHSNHLLGRGIAFSSYSEEHVLNVDTRNMSAYPDDPDHFINWCRKNPDCSRFDTELLPHLYLPRNIFGKYMEEVFREAMQYKPAFVEVTYVQGEAVDIRPAESGYIVCLGDERELHGGKIVLATGNHPPAHVPIPNMQFYSSKIYHQNPWKEDAVIGLQENYPVAIIGTGLTMVDVILGLMEKKFTGKIISISPKGFRILAHRPHHMQRDILDELEPPYELEKLFQLFRKYVIRARLNGESGETVVDAVRMKTQEIWQHLSIRDKRRFLVHLRHLWGVARHRLPGDIHAAIQRLVQEDKLEIIAGRILNIEEEQGLAKMTYLQRKDQRKAHVHVSRVINCTGPQTDITKMNSVLFRALLKNGMIAPDELGLGIRAIADGRIVTSDGKISDSVYTLGSLLKGKLWESTAVPELRVQARDLAKMILENEPANPDTTPLSTWNETEN